MRIFARHDKGTPAGGRFKQMLRGESRVVLADATCTEDDASAPFVTSPPSDYLSPTERRDARRAAQYRLSGSVSTPLAAEMLTGGDLIAHADPAHGGPSEEYRVITEPSWRYQGSTTMVAFEARNARTHARVPVLVERGGPVTLRRLATDSEGLDRI